MNLRSDFLKFGSESLPAGVDLAATAEYLRAGGFDGGALRAARDSARLSREDPFVFEPIGENYCDFCFAPIMGGEFDRLRDGRERCVRCSRTVVATVEEFSDLVSKSRRFFELAFETSLNVTLDLNMVNAKTIARNTGETFAPRPGVNPRVLGYATSGPDGYSLFIENGSPALAAATTIAHELTHIWQYLNWNAEEMIRLYGGKNQLVVYEGMATWAQVQFLLSTGEHQYAQRQMAYAASRDDEYGEGFRLFASRYPFRSEGVIGRPTPFNTSHPL